MTTETSELQHPKSKTELFLAFTLMALQGFGGVLVIVQHELVERRKWLTKAQFLEEWSVAQIMPGPNVVNLALMLGGKYFGLPGALASLCGLLLGPLVLVLSLGILFGGVADNPIAQGALKGMGAVSAGLIIATGFKLSTSLPKNPLGLWRALGFATLTFIAVGVFRLSLMTAIFGLGSLACLMAYRTIEETTEETDQAKDKGQA